MAAQRVMVARTETAEERVEVGKEDEIGIRDRELWALLETGSRQTAVHAMILEKAWQGTRSLYGAGNAGNAFGGV